MALVPGFDHDVFLSYSSIDNSEGWVSQLHGVLASELRQITGWRPRPGTEGVDQKDSIFFDEKDIKIGDAFTARLAERARNSAILLVVTSNSYFSSEPCRREKEAFAERLPARFTLSDCIFEIEARSTDPELRTNISAEAHRVPFHADGNRLKTGSALFLARAKDVAKKIADRLRALRRDSKKVFLGASPGGVWGARRRISDFVESRGFQCVPSEAVLSEPASCKSYLHECSIAVHLLGNVDHDQSIAFQHAMQTIELSLSICPERTVLFEHPEAGLSPDEKDLIREVAQSGKNVSHIRENTSSLETFIAEKLVFPSRSHAEQLPGIALIYDDPDHDWGATFTCEGIEVFRLSFQRSFSSEAIRARQEAIGRSLAAILYEGKTDRQYLDRAIQSLKPIPPERRRWYVGPPNEDSKLEPGKHRYAEGLHEFLQRIKSELEAAR
jgi:hypothetical protein